MGISDVGFFLLVAIIAIMCSNYAETTLVHHRRRGRAKLVVWTLDGLCFTMLLVAALALFRVMIDG